MNEFETRHFTVTLQQDDSFTCSFNEDSEFEVDFGANVAGEYQGAYEVTPTQQTQTLPTVNKVLTDNVVIKPIPSCYGLITYNGSIITVS